MNKPYQLKVSLTVKAPLISSGGGDVTRGINRIFYRNADGDVAMQGSHIKGKLLEAMQALAHLNAVPDLDIASLFGAGSDEHHLKEGLQAEHFIPKRAALHFSDFLLEAADPQLGNGRLTRVSIDRRTGTSKENFLQTVEQLFVPGKPVSWVGTISFFAASPEKAQAISRSLTLGLKWITALGASKGTGYGRLSEVTTSLEEWQPPETVHITADESTAYALHFQFIDDLLIGGTTRKGNYIESDPVIPGAAIKGSFARFLNRLCGANPDTLAISRENAPVYAKFPLLAEYFSQLHFSHAFPVKASQAERPVVVPLSTVQTTAGAGTGKYFDVARLEAPKLDANGRAPLFEIDWKSSDATVGALLGEFGWTSCEIINKTRTAIDSRTRRAQDEMLYTFQYLTPYESGYAAKSKTEKAQHRVKWIANLRFPGADDAVRNKMAREFTDAVRQGWHTLGKRNSRFNLTVEPGCAPDKIPPPPAADLKDQLAIVTLQTDALLFDGRALAGQAGEVDLRQVYQNYWDQATGGSCELARFFARQKFAGGYLAKRFRLYPSYYPFILTVAGSVFVLNVKDLERAQTALSGLSRQGLPLPDAIRQRIPRDKAAWEVCPFVPENGYGEIKINLPWHWDRCL